MRSMFVAVAPLLLLAACGGPETSQAKNVQANISNTLRPEDTAAASAVTPAATPSLTGDEAKKVMHERHEGMEAIGKANKALRDQLQQNSPDWAVVRTSAARIADHSQKASGWFPGGTGPDAGKTGAKPEIWQDPQDFGTKLANFQHAAQAFQGAAAGNDLNLVRTRADELGQTCKACHQKFRKDMHGTMRP